MKRATSPATLLASASLIVLAGCSSEASQPKAPIAAMTAVAAQGSYLPDPNRKYPERVLWGDEHLHTGWSVDAGVSGATLAPEDAVRFVRGETVKSNTGQDAKLERPLDWVALTDHSDGMGAIPETEAGNPEFMADPTVKTMARHDGPGRGTGDGGDAGTGPGSGNAQHAQALHGREMGRIGSGRRPSTSWKNIMSRANSPRSLPMNGRRMPTAAKICTATSSSAAMPTRRAR